MYIQILFLNTIPLAPPASSYLYFLFRTPPAPLTDDRGSIQPGDQVLLIVEDDVNFECTF